MSDAVLKRVVRRETHSPRTVATVITLVVVALGAVYAAIEIILHLVGAAPLFVAPGPALAWLVALPDAAARAGVVAGAIVVGVVGVILMWFALGPGRRPKHTLGASPHAVVVDNAVIASAVAERVRRELDLPRGRVVVGISHRKADVTVRPDPDHDVDASQVRSLAQDELAGYDSSPGLTARARIVRASDPEGTR